MKIQDKKIQNDEGFTLIELLIVVAIISILATIAIPRMLRMRQSANEASAISSMRAIASAQATYAASCGGGGFAQSMADLAKVPTGGVAFISPDLATDGATKSGYIVNVDPGTDTTVVTANTATCNSAAAAAIATYFSEAHPVSVGSTGQRSFATDHRGSIYQLPTGVAIVAAMTGATILQ